MSDVAERHHSIIGCEVCKVKAATLWHLTPHSVGDVVYACAEDAETVDPDPEHWRRLEIRD